MPPQIRMIWGFLKTFWWVIALVVVVVLVGWIYLVNRKNKRKVEEMAGNEAESLIERVHGQVREAIVDVKIEKAVIGAETAMKRKEMEEIRNEPDGKKRREKLAEALQRSL